MFLGINFRPLYHYFSRELGIGKYIPTTSQIFKNYNKLQFNTNGFMGTPMGIWTSAPVGILKGCHRFTLD